MTDTAATTTDAAAANGASPEKTEHKPLTRLVLVRHGVTAHTGPLLSGRMPGIDLSDKGVEQARAAAALEHYGGLEIGAEPQLAVHIRSIVPDASAWSTLGSQDKSMRAVLRAGRR